jgi:hypothetical protein
MSRVPAPGFGTGNPAQLVAHVLEDALPGWKWADDTGPFKIGLGSERAQLRARCH